MCGAAEAGGQAAIGGVVVLLTHAQHRAQPARPVRCVLQVGSNVQQVNPVGVADAARHRHLH